MSQKRQTIKKNSGTVPGFFQEYDIMAPRKLYKSLLDNCLVRPSFSEITHVVQVREGKALQVWECGP